ncbi:cupin domain-containing protein [Chelatococcus asaccharovorans]|uniref:cupin domain-containing protein n=1 Tax=Chelatococcus asaccharovorans TaxID=28210 RepID=UPI00224C6EAD|nr:cupin domain-containing protein [Chelatococcus asaccharovorans]CAH1661820.1 Cupin_5 domain-containing protein [Chelatococcus asaccharovorans]CAH1683355.1 Cupin_5 domain-containing protein [Chelatococcus asaccharovorans]
MADQPQTLGAAEVMALLALEPHPEGGAFRETFRDAGADARGHSTAIYYLLRAGERSHWHRVDAAEVWHWYAGAPLLLELSDDGVAVNQHVLGPDLAAGARPQFVVPAASWQAAASLGDWTLVGCTVAPGFSFAGFEMAAPGWSPGRR